METNQKPIIGIVSPCYNEALVLEETSMKLNEIIKDLVAGNIISEMSFAVYYDRLERFAGESKYPFRKWPLLHGMG